MSKLWCECTLHSLTITMEMKKENEDKLIINDRYNEDIAYNIKKIKIIDNENNNKDENINGKKTISSSLSISISISDDEYNNNNRFIYNNGVINLWNRFVLDSC